MWLYQVVKNVIYPLTHGGQAAGAPHFSPRDYERMERHPLNEVFKQTENHMIRSEALEK